jgi:2,3-bisphosphoglycerate-independent phosphoglycerate mutase
VQHVVPVETPQNILGAVLEQHNLRDLRTAETEKYPHVTFFFNGGIEKPFSTEERAMVASPKVATLRPGRRRCRRRAFAHVVKKGLVDNTFDVIVVNFANPDMVGHSGQLEPAIRACEKVDDCLSQIWPLIQQRNAAWIVTADHGNAETMIDPVTGGPHTYHTTNPVPFIPGERRPAVVAGLATGLRDIAPDRSGPVGRRKIGRDDGRGPARSIMRRGFAFLLNPSH